MKTQRRIGPKMERAVRYVAAHPGTAKMGAAHFASPYPGNHARLSGLAYGYRSVDRAIAAGLIDCAPGRGVAWSLTITPAGESLARGLDS